jgi:DNA-dependent RNA polymerase auxiliary subunit epsilon
MRNQECEWVLAGVTHRAPRRESLDSLLLHGQKCEAIRNTLKGWYVEIAIKGEFGQT